ncbi:MAG: KamA family radical SAM protein [Kiritimatiellae bacterium]|nr:KamA family radical SAM protein [Kiritimatiellia bacterium]
MKSLDELLAEKSLAPELWNDWRWQLKNSVSSAKEFLSLFGVADDIARYYKKVIKQYPIRITPYYLSLISLGDPEQNPVLGQCLPDIQEIKHSTGCIKEDPFGEVQHMPVPGIIHRYKDRLVLLVTDHCAMNCRHCTRKNILGGNVALHSDEQLQKAFEYIQAAEDVREVLISGGDPLMLEAAQLDYILNNVSSIDHVEVMRIGTRIPVVMPMRIDDELCKVLTRYRPLWINTQFNHPVELTAAAIAACDRLIRLGLPVSNQAVLLKGVNDDVAVMRELCVKLQRNMIRPYYVFQCDPVVGTEHFRTDLSVGIEMEEELRRTIGGLALPRFVADLPDTEGKVPLSQVE